MDFINLIDARPPSPLSEKYNVATYEDYKMFAKGNKDLLPFPPARTYTPVQQLAFALECMEKTVMSKPKYLVLNESMVRKFLKIGTTIPEDFEGVALTVDLTSPFEITFIL